MEDRVLIAPSILSADFARLAQAVALMESAGADMLHIDVMDGHFVPNLTIGPPVVKALREVTALHLDCHLMVSDPDSMIDWFVDAGADGITVHAEAATHLHGTVQRIRAAGVLAAVSVNPGTPVSALDAVLGEVDRVLIMSVNPGFGGQSFIASSTAKVAQIANRCAELGCAPEIQVDGGINDVTAPLVVEAGARCLVAGNAVFGDPDPAAALARLRDCASVAL